MFGKSEKEVTVGILAGLHKFKIWTYAWNIQWIGFWTEPADFSREKIGLQLVAKDGNAGKSHSFNLKQAASL